MSADPADLANLHDIVVPPPAPWWPPAPGWLWLAGFAALLLLALLLRGIAGWQANRYRREALAELARLEQDAGKDAARAPVLAGLSALLKRTALTAYGRERVASLTGPAWFAFLDSTGGTRFADGPGAALEDAVYRAGTIDDALFGRILGDSRTWIRAHRPLPGAAGSGDTTGSDDTALVPALREAA